MNLGGLMSYVKLRYKIKTILDSAADCGVGNAFVEDFEDLRHIIEIILKTKGWDDHLFLQHQGDVEGEFGKFSFEFSGNFDIAKNRLNEFEKYLSAFDH